MFAFSFITYSILILGPLLKLFSWLLFFFAFDLLFAINTDRKGLLRAKKFMKTREMYLKEDEEKRKSLLFLLINFISISRFLSLTSLL